MNFLLTLQGLLKWHPQTETGGIHRPKQPGGAFFNHTKNILIIFIAAQSVVNGQMTLGMMMAVQYIIGQLNAPVEQMIGFVRSAQDAKISLERLGEIHLKKDEEPVTEEGNPLKNTFVKFFIMSLY